MSSSRAALPVRMRARGEEGVRCEDCIAKERSEEETPKSFKVDDACGVVHG